MLCWAPSSAGIGEFVSFIYPANEASKAVTRKLGATRGPDVPLLGIDGIECWHYRAPDDR